MKDKYQLKSKEEALWEGNQEDPMTMAQIDAIGFLRGETDPITDTVVPVPQTNEDLGNLIAILRSERKDIREYSMFGDPNWQIIDAQIEICEWAKS